ncbi:MAG: FtsW/RodA/SpoVE family cell cycle protein [Oscillospiraceae bacterium]|jgi:rod shape determining protein RodA|nr:FtsW/RodA/SpoVE family cell cycle protein [Oscillospiraceae bacterium]
MASKSERKTKALMRGERSGLRLYAGGTDFVTLGLCLLASIYGLVLVYSATLRVKAEDALLPRDVFTMLIALIGGIIAALVISFVDYTLLLKFWYIMAGVCLLLMLGLIPFGVAPDARSDARSWYDLKVFSFQPSELLKIGFIISYTWHLTKVKDEINKLKNIALLGAHAFVPFSLVILTGDLGSALVFLSIAIGMLFIAGLKLRYFAAAFALAAAALPILWVGFFNDFQKNRILAVYTPDKLDALEYKTIIYQQQQARNAMGSGQVFGKGLFKGSYIQSGSVPECENDMILSVAGEELGFIGACAVIVLIGIIIIRMIRVSTHTSNLQARSICTGVALLIGAQAIINIGMCIMVLPVIGITLPFFSAGGSSTLTLYCSVGLVLSVYRYQNEHEDAQSYMNYLFS